MLMELNKNHPFYKEDLHNILSVNGIADLQGKTILITGATGMVGVMLIDSLMALGSIKVIAVGRSIEKAKQRLGEYFSNPNFLFLTHDVCRPFSGDLQADIVIPLASNTHPMAYSLYPIETMMINIKGAEYALDLAARCGATLLYPSSCEIYGNAISDNDFSEDCNGRISLSNARSCYTESKRSAEALCQSYMAEKGVMVKIVRLCRIFGPTMLESDSKASSQFIKNAIDGADIVLKSKGNQYFSYTYVADAISGLLTVLLNGEYGVAYNVSSEKTNVHLKSFASICAEYNGRNVVFQLPSDYEREGYSFAMRSILSSERIKSIGFEPKYEIKEAINRTIEILKPRK